MNNEEASHYQSGIFIGIKAHAGLGERCGKTKGEWFFCVGFLEMYFVSVRFVPEAILRTESITGSWRRSWEGSQRLIWCEGVLYVKLRKQWLKYGGARRQKSTTEIYSMVRGALWKKHPLSLCSSWFGMTVWGWAKPQRRGRLEYGLRFKFLLKYENIIKKSVAYLAWCMFQRKTQRVEVITRTILAVWY